MKEQKIVTHKKTASADNSKDSISAILFRHMNSQKSLSEVLKAIAFPVALLIMCMIGSSIIALLSFGDGAYAYSDTTYDFIKETTLASVIADETGETGEIEKGGVDIAMLRENGIHYDISDTDSGSKIDVHIKNGFFKAKETFYVSDSFNFTMDEPVRNYDNRAQYMQYFWLSLAFFTFIIGPVVWLALICLYFGITALVKWRAEKKNAKASTEESLKKLSMSTANQEHMQIVTHTVPISELHDVQHEQPVEKQVSA